MDTLTSLDSPVQVTAGFIRGGHYEHSEKNVARIHAGDSSCSMRLGYRSAQGFTRLFRRAVSCLHYGYTLPALVNSGLRI